MTLYRIAIVIFILLLPGHARAWSSTIHQAVCEIVWQQLERDERDWLIEIIQDHDIKKFSTGCAWPDWVRKEARYVHTRGWHYQNFDAPPMKDENCLKGCLLRAIRRNYHGLHTTTGRERSDALYFLAHLIADLHQPLHTGRTADKGGNLLLLQFEGKETNLHKIWDSRMLARQKSKIIFEIQSAANHPVEDFEWPESLDLWYMESGKIAREQIYPAYDNKPIIDADYIAEFRPLSYQLLSRAADRTTQVLRYIFRESHG